MLLTPGQTHTGKITAGMKYQTPGAALYSDSAGYERWEVDGKGLRPAVNVKMPALCGVASQASLPRRSHLQPSSSPHLLSLSTQADDDENGDNGTRLSKSRAPRVECPGIRLLALPPRVEAPCYIYIYTRLCQPAEERLGNGPLSLCNRREAARQRKKKTRKQRRPVGRTRGGAIGLRGFRRTTQRFSGPCPRVNEL